MITTWWSRRLRTLSPKSFSSMATVPVLLPALSNSWRSAMGLLLVQHGLHPDVDPGGHVQVAEFVDRLGRGLGDVDHALVRPDLVLLARLLVDVRRAQDGDPLDFRGERNRTAHLRTGALRRVHDVHRGLVDHLVIVALDADADALCHNPFVASRKSDQYIVRTLRIKSKHRGTRRVPYFPAFARTASRSSG